MQSLPAAMVKQSRTGSHSGLHGELMSLQHILYHTEPRTCEEHSQIHVHRAR